MTARKKSKQSVRGSSASTPAGSTREVEAQFLPPFKPHPKLMIALGIALLLWLGALVVMRMTTVRPAPGHAVETDRTLTH